MKKVVGRDRAADSPELRRLLRRAAV